MITRGRANSMTTATNWFVNFWFALYIPTALNKISWKLYIIFAVICFAAAISTFLFQVETANRSLEEMDVMFDPDKTMWAFMDKDLTQVHPRRDMVKEEHLRAIGHQTLRNVSTGGKNEGAFQEHLEGA